MSISLYMHEQNINGKIESKDSYLEIKNELKKFKEKEYLKMRRLVNKLTFDSANPKNFDIAAEIFTEYYDKLKDFSKKYQIAHTSKFESSFLEEISCYLFKDIPQIKTGSYEIFNKGIFAGLSIDTKNNVYINTKDVDFCIGIQTEVHFGSVDGFSQKKMKKKPPTIIIPIVAVEVKTYMDATMFGEIRSSGKLIRNASPDSKTYVLMRFNETTDEKIVLGRQDGSLTEMFVLSKGTRKNYSKTLTPILGSVLWDYWNEIKHSVDEVSNSSKISEYGRLISPEKTYKK